MWVIQPIFLPNLVVTWQDYYPERLGKLLLLHVPYIFMSVWKVIYPFIDNNTKKKVRFGNSLFSCKLARVISYIIRFCLTIHKKKKKIHVLSPTTQLKLTIACINIRISR